MAKNPKTTTSSAPIDTPDIKNQIAANLAAADQSASQRVQTLAWVHQARAAQLSRSAVRLKAQYGPDDAGVKSAEASAAAANATAAQARMAQLQAATPAPEVAPKGWALHGRVFDAQFAPASGYTVFFVDGSKTYQQTYGFAYTDASGYFLLNFSGAEESTGRAPAASQNTAQGDLFVEIVDTKSQPAFLSTTAFQPVIGSAVYQNIVLPADKQPIGDPPSEVRKVAIPKTPRKSS